MAAADFYFAINATFKFIYGRFGHSGLIRYWRELACEHYRPVAERFRLGGLNAVEAYWSNFFAHEPIGDVSVTSSTEQVRIEVRQCPAISWLRQHERDLAPHFCEHCQVINTELANQAGLNFDLAGGGGACVQRFSRREGHNQ